MMRQKVYFLITLLLFTIKLMFYPCQLFREQLISVYYYSVPENIFFLLLLKGNYKKYFTVIFVISFRVKLYKTDNKCQCIVGIQWIHCGRPAKFCYKYYITNQ